MCKTTVWNAVGTPSGSGQQHIAFLLCTHHLTRRTSSPLLPKSTRTHSQPHYCTKRYLTMTQVSPNPTPLRSSIPGVAQPSALRGDSARRAGNSRPFWRVSFASHHPAASAQQLARLFRDHGASLQIGADGRSAVISAGDMWGAAGAAAAAAGGGYTASAPRPLRLLPQNAPLDTGDSGPTNRSGASSFDVIEGMPRSRPPSVRSVGSLLLVGSPDSRAARRVPSEFSLGSLAPTPLNRSNNLLADLDGCVAEARDTPTSQDSQMSFPTVSAMTPQSEMAHARSVTLGSPRSVDLNGTARMSARSARRTPGAACSAAHQGHYGLSKSASSDGLASRHSASDGPASIQPTLISITAPATAPAAGAGRSSIHFKIMDDRHTVGVGLSRAAWGDSSTRRAHGPAFVNDAVSALFRVLNKRHGGDIPATPPNSEADDDDEEVNDADIPNCSMRTAKPDSEQENACGTRVKAASPTPTLDEAWPSGRGTIPASTFAQDDEAASAFAKRPPPRWGEDLFRLRAERLSGSTPGSALGPRHDFGIGRANSMPSMAELRGEWDDAALGGASNPGNEQQSTNASFFFQYGPKKVAQGSPTSVF
jgi:hypothetical protein